jgi:nitrate reductase cytochrome c-type subunit
MNVKQVIISILVAVVLNSCNSANTKQQTNKEDAGLQGGQGDTVKPGTDYLALGKSIATETQAVLAKKLMGAINKGRTEYALAFCNTNALTLTDSMAHALSARIKRVSDKPRNAGNQANEIELAYIQVLKNRMASGEQPEAKMNEIEGKMVGFFPIVTNQMCMQCHGKAEVNIKAATLQKINKLYPDDKATGYSDNEVRGLWVIEMDRKLN